MAREIVLVDGRIVGDGQVRLAASDPGLLAGVSVFETVRVHEGRFLELPAHLARWRRSAALLGLSLPPERTVLAACWAAQAALGLAEAVVRITATGGGRWVVWARQAPPRRREVRCITRPAVIDPWVPAAAKHGNRLRGRLALAGQPADEVIWIGAHGGMVEGSWSSVLAVKDGVVLTHPADGSLLPGITRAAVLRIAVDQGTPVEERPVAPGEALDELYLSSSVHGLVPVVELDGRPAPGGGPVGAALSVLLWARSTG
jgi:branched-subunit amino acid aminotransferase/4-amino-4-deoxychorismate lyase